MTLVPETPIQKKDCIVSECKKAPNGFKTSRGLKGHMKKFHDIVLDALSPAASTARVLFESSSDTPSVQGNSKGQVNYLEVLSEGVHQCGKCPEQFTSRDEVKKHMDYHHDKAKAARPTDKLVNSGKGSKEKEVADIEVLINDSEDEEDLANLMEDIEDGDLARDMENRASVDKIVQTFIDKAFTQMHPTEIISNHCVMIVT